MTHWRPAAGLFGLHVDLGFFHADIGRWLRLPVATFTCRWGCERVAVGAADVAHLTEHFTEDHARTCPGHPRKESAA